MMVKNINTPGGNHSSGNPPVGKPTVGARILEAPNTIQPTTDEAVASLAAPAVKATSQQSAEQSSAFLSSSKILRSPILQATRSTAMPTGGVPAGEDKETPKRTREQSSPSEPQRSTPAKRTRAATEQPCSGMLAELEAILEDIIQQTHEKQVRSINLKMKRMFCRMKELQEGLSGILSNPSDAGTTAAAAEVVCSRCGQADTAKTDQKTQTLLTRRKEAAAQTDPWRRLSQDSATPLPRGAPLASANNPKIRAREGPTKRTSNHPDPRTAGVGGQSTAALTAAPGPGWETATRRKPRTFTRPDALVVEAKGRKYSEVLALVTRRQDGQLKEFSQNVHKVRRTATGNLLLELSKNRVDSTDAMRENLEKVLQGAAEVRALSEDSKMKYIEIRDLDPLATEGDIRLALAEQFEVDGKSATLRSLRARSRDTQTAIIGLPSKIATAVVNKGRLATLRASAEAPLIGADAASAVAKAGIKSPTVQTRAPATFARQKARRRQSTSQEVDGVRTPLELAAQELLRHTVGEMNADIAILSEPYSVGPGEEWSTNNQGKAAIWICKGSAEGPRQVRRGEGFVRIQWGGTWVYSCYLAPSLSHDAYCKALEELAVDARGKHPVLIAGDFNAWAQEWGSTTTNARGRALLEILAPLDLALLNEGNQETFNRAGAGSIIDLTFVSSSLARTSEWRIADIYTASDHEAILCSLGISRATSRIPPCGKAYRQDTLDVQQLANHMRRAQLDLHTTANETAAALAAALDAACKACMKARTTFARHHKPAPWWTSHISALRKECLRARRSLQRARGTDAQDQRHLEFKAARKTLKKAIRDSKRELFLKLCDEAEHDPWGQAYKIVTKKVRAGSQPPSDPVALSAIIDVLFPSCQGEGTRPAIEDFEEESVEAVTAEEVLAAARNLAPNKAPGPDAVPNRALKVVLAQIPEKIAAVYNQCLLEGSFPKVRKKQRLLLQTKPGKPPGEAASYRPICLLDTVGKVLEKILATRLQAAISREGGLAEEQYGFRKGRSTIDAIMRVKSLAASAIQGTRWEGGTKQYCLVTTLDVKNAFNTASWSRTLEALKELRIPEYLLKMVDSYLSDRVLLYDTQDGLKERVVSAGVPQGSVLGPLLWNTMYDGVLRLPMEEGTTIVGFADDIAIVVVAKTVRGVETQTNSAVANVEAWLSRAGLQLAPQKTEAVLISSRKKVEIATVHVGGVAVTSGRAIKYLGVWLDTRLSFREHLDVGRGDRSKVLRTRNRGRPPSLRATDVLRPYDGVGRRGPRDRRSDTRPIQELVQERKELANMAQESPSSVSARKRKARATSLSNWQRRWEASSKGRWMFRLIPDVGVWTGRKHGQVDIYLTQALSGRFEEDRLTLEEILEEAFTPSSMVPQMLQTLVKWEAIAVFVAKMMTELRALERARNGREE
ncbi:uncharacterized protein [Drosophila bipectinata]|uniref:uncharacterized protein n=1 Tax=Drosophila bipectinata TaxID=42026 RepID=UPI0038B37133